MEVLRPLVQLPQSPTVIAAIATRHRETMTEEWASQGSRKREDGKEMEGMRSLV